VGAGRSRDRRENREGNDRGGTHGREGCPIPSCVCNKNRVRDGAGRWFVMSPVPRGGAVSLSYGYPYPTIWVAI
jgi:hypothetical protein